MGYVRQELPSNVREPTMFARTGDLQMGTGMDRYRTEGFQWHMVSLQSTSVKSSPFPYLAVGFVVNACDRAEGAWAHHRVVNYGVGFI